MENLSHSLSKKSYSGNGFAVKTVYDDVFGGPPKFGVPTLSPRVEEYREIFGSFQASRASSIPTLDLPVIDDAYLSHDVRSSNFDYSEVFGGFNSLDFAISYEELLGQSNGRHDSSEEEEEEEAWTPAQSESLSDESEPFACSEKNQSMSNGDSDQSLDGIKQFNISYHKANQRRKEDISNGMTHVTQLHTVPAFTVVVDETSVPQKIEDENPLLKVTSDLNVTMDFGGGIMEGKLLRKTMSHPANSGFGIQAYGNDLNPLAGKAASSLNETFVGVSDISLRTRPSHLPPPSRPPPVLTVKKGDSDRPNSKLKASKSYAFERMAADSSPYFDVEVDASSSAAASAAAMKVAMEKAQAKLRSAKELMEKKKEGLQSRTKLRLENDINKEGKMNKAFGGSNSFKDERMQGTDERECSKIKPFAGEERKDETKMTQVVAGVVEGEKQFNVAEKPAENKHGKEYRLSQGSHKTEETVAWREATQYFEVVETEKYRKNFKQVKEENILVQNKASHERGKGKKPSIEAFEWQEDDKKIKAPKEACEWEENANHLKVGKGACEWHENKGKSKTTKDVCSQEEHEEKVNVIQKVCESQENKKLRAAQQHEEIEKLLVEANKGEGCEILIKLKQKENVVESKQELKGAQERLENKKRLDDAHERKENGQGSEETFEAEEYERRLEEDVERVENEKSLRERVEQEEKEKQQKDDHGREENKKKQVHETQEDENKLKEPLEQEENEKRLKEAIEREECDKKLKIALEQEQNDKQQKLIHEREENKKRLREAVKLQEKEKKFKDALEHGENAKKKKEAHEREENEKRLNDAREREQLRKRLEEAWKQEEKKKTLQEAHEGEESKKQSELTFKEEAIEKSSKKTSDWEKTENSNEDAGKYEDLTGPNEDDEKIERDKNKSRLILDQTICIPQAGENFKVFDGAFKLNNNETLPATQVVCEHEENTGKLEASQEALSCEESVKLSTKSKSTEGEMRATKVANMLIEETFNSSGMVQDDLQHEKNQIGVEVAMTSLHLDDRVAKSNEASIGIGMTLESNKRASQIPFDVEESKDKFISPQLIRELAENERKVEAAPPAVLEAKGNAQNAAQKVRSQTGEGKEKNSNETLTSEEREKEERLRKEKELEMNRLRKIEEDREREREREKDRMAVDMLTRERAFAEARERAERAAVERATAEVRQRAMAEARERLEKASSEARERSLVEKAAMEARLRAERSAVERATAEARERAVEKAMAEKAAIGARERMERSVADKFSTSSKSGRLRQSSSSSDLQDLQFQSVGSSNVLRYSFSSLHGGVEGESAQRCKARLERHRRTAERAAKALAEKNMRDLLAQREQAERNRLAEALDAEVKRWSSGKEGNLRALLSTLQYILGSDSGWHPVPLTEVITNAAVKKAYRKATLCVHPDKLQQRGASIQQKYICEKVFDLLKEAWNKFNSEEG